MLDGLTAPAYRYCWTWSIEDSAHQTSPGKFLLVDTVPDLHSVTCSRVDLTCRNLLQLRSGCYFSVANTGLCELLIWAGLLSGRLSAHVSLSAFEFGSSLPFGDFSSVVPTRLDIYSSEDLQQ